MKQESTATLSQRLLLLAYYAIRGDGSHCAFFWAWWLWKKSCWCCSALKTGNISGCWPQDVSEYSCEHLPQLDSECTGTNHTHHGENCIFPWILGPFDTADNLTPRTIWHFGQFDNIMASRTIWHHEGKEDNLTPRTIWHRGQFDTIMQNRTIWHHHAK